MRRFVSIAIVLLCLVLCGCDSLGGDISNRIFPPKPSGQLYQIQQVLEDYVGSKINLVYPSAGAYRSAIITEDITGDGQYEVFAFYSTKTDEKTTIMHVNYIKKENDAWVSAGDIQVTASGVESVEFAYLDKARVPKIIVSWNRFSVLEKRLSVYDIDSGVLTEVSSAPYSTYTTCDFDKNGIKEIIAVHMNVEENKASASLLSLTDKGFAEQSRVDADSMVVSYGEPRVSFFTDGTPAVFIDANKNAGVITEAFSVKNGKLINVFGSVGGENRTTLRVTETLSKDFNNDGTIDIPLAIKLPSVPGANESDSVHMIKWHSSNGQQLEPIKSVVINYNDGYQLIVPKEWEGNFTIVRDIENFERIMYRWDSELNDTGEEILRIRAIPVSIWSNDSDKYKDYEEITRDDKNVFAVKLSNSALTPEFKTVQDSFSLIDG